MEQHDKQLDTGGIKFKLTPIYDTVAILKNWRFFLEGMEKIILHSDDDMSETTVLNRLLSGQLLLWVGWLNGKYCGFATTKVDEVPFGKKYLWIVHVYIAPHTPRDVFFEGLKILGEYAKKYGCDALKFYTTREQPFAKRLSNLGWRVSYTEFVYDLKGGKDENLQ